MSLIKKNELRQLTEPQINQKLSELRRELLKLNSQRAMGTTPENPGKIKQVKKTVAKLHTKLTEIKSIKNTQEVQKISMKKKPTEAKKTNE